MRESSKKECSFRSANPLNTDPSLIKRLDMDNRFDHDSIHRSELSLSQ